MNNRPFDDAMIDRCCLYLLGEMPAAEADDFQRESAASVELAACLSQQAELISELGIALAEPFVAESLVNDTDSRPAAAKMPQPAPGWNISRWLSSRGAVATAFALAASLLLWIGLQRSSDFLPGEVAPETLQLAHAWAAGRGDTGTADDWPSSQWLVEPWEVADLSGTTDLLAVDNGGLGAGLPADDMESASSELGPPQWLIVAVRAMDAEATAANSAERELERSAASAEASDE